MMERMLRHLLDEYGMSYRVEVASAGLLETAAEGKPMAEFSMAELTKRGIDAQGHTSCFIGDIGYLDEVRYILTVGQDEADQLMAKGFHNPNTQILILGGGIPNPWQQGEEAYRACADQIEESLQKVLDLFR
jgi:protein-tyrosine-phosphatase